MSVLKTEENQRMIIKKEQIETGQGNKSSSITAIDLTGSPTSKYSNLETSLEFWRIDIETKRFDSFQANRGIIESNRQSSFRSMLGKIHGRIHNIPNESSRDEVALFEEALYLREQWTQALLSAHICLGRCNSQLVILF